MIATIIGILLATFACFCLYTFLRPKFKYCVNCWFCNKNQWVLYYQRNSFTCKKCDQYNGFDENGDYNKFIPSQSIESLNINNPSAKRIQFRRFPSHNGLCEICNQMQAVIVERLNKFEAVDEKRYFEEFNNYKFRLNQNYPLCNECREYTEQKLQIINQGYLQKPNSVIKTQSMASNPFALRSDSSMSHSPSLISESSSFARSVFSKPRRRAPSVSSRSSSREPSPFFPRDRAPSIFSVPSKTPAFVRTSYAPTVASGFSYKTAHSHPPSFLRKQRILNNDRLRKLCFASGEATVICNVLNFLISFILFIFFFDSSQISRDVKFLVFEKYLSLDTVNKLHLCKNYSAFVAAFASGIFYYGFNQSKTCINIFDLLASNSWPLFTVFCIFDAKRNPDFNLIKMIFAAYLFILSSMILFIPKKRKHQKRSNNIYSSFSIASSPASQCSSRFPASKQSHNYSNSSSLSQSTYSELPDPVEAWVSSAVDEQQTVTRLHSLHI